jgi:hypothetical protein
MTAEGTVGAPSCSNCTNMSISSPTTGPDGDEQVQRFPLASHWQPRFSVWEHDFSKHEVSTKVCKIDIFTLMRAISENSRLGRWTFISLLSYLSSLYFFLPSADSKDIAEGLETTFCPFAVIQFLSFTRIFFRVYHKDGSSRVHHGWRVGSRVGSEITICSLKTKVLL